MGVLTFIYWGSFYAALFGVLANENISFRQLYNGQRLEYTFELILTTHLTASFIYIFSLLYFNIPRESRIYVAIPLGLSLLFSAEYFWYKYKKIIKIMASTISFYLVLFVLIALITFYSSSASSTYIEKLTRINSGVFDSFILFLTVIVAAGWWVIVLMIVMFVLLAISFVEYFKNANKRSLSHNSVKFSHIVFFVSIMVMVFSSVVLKMIDGRVIPYVVNNYFVNRMYHENEDSNKKPICKNIDKDERFVFLPSGKISVVKKGTLDFQSPKECDRI